MRSFIATLNLGNKKQSQRIKFNDTTLRSLQT